MKDTILYDRLGVSSDANNKELKKAYHKLSMKWHPDKNNSEEAKEKFQEISEAYSILSDEGKRKLYNQVGIEMTKNGGAPTVDPTDIFKHFMSGMGGMGGMGGFSFGGPGFGGPGFGSAFSSRFNGNPFERSTNASKYEDCIVNLNVTLDDLYNEKTVKVQYKQKSYCKQCNGYGTSNGLKSECSKCNGTGRMTITRQLGNMIQQIVRTCDECNGSGENINSMGICSACNGSKFKIKNKSMDFCLNNKIRDGNRITIKEKGHIYKDVKTDLVIIINEQKHPVFTRINDDLHLSLNIKLYQLIFGLNTTIKHLDGRELFINIKQFDLNNLNERITYSVENEGINNNSKMILHIEIDNLSTSVLEENEKTILKKLLVKCDLNQFKKEVSILKNKNNLTNTTTRKYNLEQYSHNTNNEQYNSEENSPECVTQ